MVRVLIRNRKGVREGDWMHYPEADSVIPHGSFLLIQGQVKDALIPTSKTYAVISDRSLIRAEIEE